MFTYHMNYVCYICSYIQNIMFLMKPFIYSYTGMSHFYYLCVCHVYVHVGSACIRGYVYIMNAYLCTSMWGLELLLCMFFSVTFHLIFLRKGLSLNLECLDLARLSDH